ncbi:type IV toxin-antitoxin system AbiEi family antitoxin domain-containing protein [Tsukamurella spumae]|uniref:DUF559 domain-containing protein n=1 Tax=Tsukamurella spumae TaxID=44753 RepID=A0A846X643_9ACTN|nr:type IV toxin-antitoxin system AbiEi family antitoxin domain-containing protein [Tsukamurella spumae]NKY19672.1 DUF559 domain-containing protein [Tsukamurella spumae]
MHTIEILQALAAPDGGVFSRRAALRAGADSAEIERLRHLGDIVVIRRGWYRLPGANAVVVAAVKGGAVITCVSALSFRPGVWIPPRKTAKTTLSKSKTHLRRARHRRTRSHEDCDAYQRLPSPTRAVDDLSTALRCAANCLDADEFVAVLDSVLRMTNPHTIEDLEEIFVDAPERTKRLLSFLDPESGSGTESLTRFRLARLHIRVRSQQTIPGIGRVDLLVGDKLIIECDSTDHHSGVQRLVDNKRDRTATRGNYRVMRFDYTEVVADWDAILAEILDIVRTDRHMGAVRVVESADEDDTRPDPAS